MRIHHIINTVNTKGYHVIGVNVIPAQERPNRCALYYSCACDFEVVNGNARLCINKPFFSWVKPLPQALSYLILNRRNLLASVISLVGVGDGRARFKTQSLG